MNVPDRQPAVPISLLAVFFSLFSFQCGYHFLGPGGEPTPGVERLAVPVLVNRTEYRGVEAILTRKLIDEIERRGIATVVPVEQADAVLEGTVLAISQAASAYAPEADRVVNYSISMRVGLTLVRASDRKVLWRLMDLADQEYFDTRGVAVQLESCRWDALARAAEAIAREAVNRWGGGW